MSIEQSVDIGNFSPTYHHHITIFINLLQLFIQIYKVKMCIDDKFRKFSLF